MKLISLGIMAVMLLPLYLPQVAVAQADYFDAPMKKKVVDFGPSPYYSGGKVRITLSCFFYATFMVKQYDEGQKGAEWLAIAPSKKGPGASCTRSHAVGEKVIEYPEWTGYFKGAKGDLVFFIGADGINGAMPFVIYDSRTGAKMFEDSYYDADMWTKKPPNSPFNRLRIRKIPDGQILLVYLRVVGTDCDLYREKALCWEVVRNNLGVKTTQPPVCTGYEDTTSRYPSSVAYPVEVSLFPQPTTKVIDGPVKCWPVD